MAKKFNFDKKMENDANNVIEEILQADFPLPKQAEAAKNEAFAKIREMAAVISKDYEGKSLKVQRIHIAKKIEKSKVWKLTNIVRMTESLLIIAIQRNLTENSKQSIRQHLA